MQALAHLHAAYPFWLWGGVAAALLAIEVLSGSGWLLWAAASAAVTAVVAQVAGLSPTFAILVFAGLTIVSTLAARRYLRRPLVDSVDINDNIARLIGHRGRVATPFEGRFGRVMIDGKEWPAELEDDSSPAEGSLVEVVSVSGGLLNVRHIPL